ncbi:MAG TPA: hypothetical protein VFT45_05730 [Longimicrobium sp.]|nr:hypothetical protein [Longimicrobium sp.]
MRTFAAVPAALLLLAAACSDLPTATLPTPQSAPPGTFRAELSCTASIASRQVACAAADAADGSASRPSLIIGGQNVYVRLEATGAGYNPSDSIFQIDVTVQNLMTQTFGASDDETATGLTVFFYLQPHATAGSGSIAVDNEDGSDIFLTEPTPYFTYEGLLYTSDVSEAKTWRFKTDPEVEAFHFQVFVQGQLPHEGSLLLFRPSYTNEETYVNGIWGSSASALFAVGSGGALARYTGGVWVDDEPLNAEELWDVWGSSASDVFAVGDFGTIVHWNGTAWEEMDSGLGCGCESFYSVWGSGPTDVYAVGDGGLILHYDGAEWVPRDTVPADGLAGVWGSGPSDVFAVGDFGAIFHYDGTGWTPMTSGLEDGDDFMISIWGFSSTDVYATHSNGVLHYDGVSWSPLDGARECPTFNVWGSAPNDLFVANICGIDHFDGATWAHMDPGGVATDLIGFGPHTLFANSDYYVYRGSR